ncbi:integrase arm-type DNA-binding domain-containing protein [Acinetobacter sp. ME22]|uniref:tyrosine-type recombinase/integrase n=1 Tax=Acinetobacter sp. ME22 TaxID=2904802 RepID=UPI001EDC4065|nr:integrase arm-type DNA-binding domain-containing protein [Acinetobacter sp. ME22]MCG2574341.1 integrase arm-type DNA-binding domain-containing protein [Acinetobacter sp. ME22]
MAKHITPLTDSKCTGAKPQEKDYSLYDGQGLILFIRKSGSKVWRYKYKRANGKDGLMTLGNFPALTLKAARSKRRELEELIANGVDPIEHEEIQKTKLKNAYSFEAIAREWHKEYSKTGRWVSETADRALRNLEEYVLVMIGTKPIDTIKPKDLAAVLRSIEEKGYTEVVKKTRQRLNSIFAYAISKGLIEENPAYFLKDVFVTTKAPKHHPQLALNKLPELQQRLANDTGYPLTKLCTTFALHTFVRSSELRFARWTEFDLEKGVWNLPATREHIAGQKYSNRGAKMKTDHLIPLSPQAITLLKEIHKYSGMTKNVFPKNGDPNGFISESTINKTLRRLGYDTDKDVCGHGFRGMACSALVQSTLFQKEAVEKQMSHQERDQVRLAYTHTAEYLEERKAMLNWWSDYLEANLQEHISPYDFTKQLLGEDVIQFKYAKLVK